MALVVGVTSYVDVTTATAYLGDRLDSGVWDSASTKERASALVSATRILDQLEWVGCVANDDQSLAFPRLGTYYDNRLGYNVSLQGTEIPQRIKDAICELALHLLSNEDVEAQAALPSSVSIVGAVTLTGLDNTVVALIPPKVRTLCRPLRRRGGRSWWRTD